MTKPSFQGEIMLAGWQESHTAGAKITFWLPDAEDLEPFKGMTSKKGNTAGQRFMAVLVEIGDDELPKDEAINHFPDATKMVEKPKGGQLARLAGMWCIEPEFWEWLNTLDSWLPIENESDAKCAIYVLCSIDSRAELDNNPEAAEKFHRLIRIPYMEYLKTL